MLSSSARGVVVRYTPRPGQVVLRHLRGTCSCRSPRHLKVFPSTPGRKDLPRRSQLQRQSHLLSLLSGFQGGVRKPPEPRSDLPFRVHTTREFWHQKGHQLCLLLPSIQHQGPPCGPCTPGCLPKAVPGPDPNPTARQLSLHIPRAVLPRCKRQTK